MNICHSIHESYVYTYLYYTFELPLFGVYAIFQNNKTPSFGNAYIHDNAYVRWLNLACVMSQTCQVTQLSAE